jgi:hypothetical protein
MAARIDCVAFAAAGSLRAGETLQGGGTVVVSARLFLSSPSAESNACCDSRRVEVGRTCPGAHTTRRHLRESASRHDRIFLSPTPLQPFTFCEKIRLTPGAAATPVCLRSSRVGHRRRSCSGANGVGPVRATS